MMKECFETVVVDAKKFRECAACPLFDPCTSLVNERGFLKARTAGMVLGLLLAAYGVFLAVANWGRLPNGAPWLLLFSLVYALAVAQAHRETQVLFGEKAAALKAEAEAGGKPATPAAHGGHPAH
ncbi:MAG: hypothetical protein ACP5VN_01325 [Acidobacteriota bacterium]